MGEYQKGTRVRVREDVPATGDYGEYAGETGTVLETCPVDECAGKIQFDNGNVLAFVRQSAVVPEDAPPTDARSSEKLEFKLEARIERLERRLEDERLKLRLVTEFGFERIEEDVLKAARALSEAGSEDYSIETLFTIAYGQVGWPEYAERLAGAGDKFTRGDRVRVAPNVDWSEYHSTDPTVKKPGFAPGMEGLAGEAGTVKQHTGRGVRVEFKRAGGTETWTILGKDLEPA